jgi:2-oxoglutarate ferredoxin oxidoreductase subunit alpha
MNLGQLALLLRGRFLVDAVGFNQVRGLPFTAPQMQDVINQMLEEVR